MITLKKLLIILFTVSLLSACPNTKAPAIEKEKPTPPWWESVTPITIDGNDYYGQPCSVFRMRTKDGAKTPDMIYTVPGRALTICSGPVAGANYLDYDGEYIILDVHRQTVGAGSSTGELLRSKDFKNWQEYIGVTWRNSEEYEAWRNVGSTSSKADSIKKVQPEAPPEPEGPIHVGGDVTKPIKISSPQPAYTEIARKARIQGVVIVQAIIDKNGDVTKVKVLKGLQMGLEDEAVKAIKTWKFKPATLNDKPVDVYYNLTVNFRLQ